MKIKMKTYYYCNICGKPIKEDNSDNDYNFCLDCALELYQKIFCSESDES